MASSLPHCAPGPVRGSCQRTGRGWRSAWSRSRRCEADVGSFRKTTRPSTKELYSAGSIFLFPEIEDERDLDASEAAPPSPRDLPTELPGDLPPEFLEVDGALVDERVAPFHGLVRLV